MEYEQGVWFKPFGAPCEWYYFAHSFDAGNKCDSKASSVKFHYYYNNLVRDVGVFAEMFEYSLNEPMTHLNHSNKLPWRVHFFIWLTHARKYENRFAEAMGTPFCQLSDIYKKGAAKEDVLAIYCPGTSTVLVTLLEVDNVGDSFRMRDVYLKPGGVLFLHTSAKWSIRGIGGPVPKFKKKGTPGDLPVNRLQAGIISFKVIGLL